MQKRKYFYHPEKNKWSLHLYFFWEIPIQFATIRHTLGFPGGSDGKEPACNAGDLGSICGLGRSPGGGNGNILQCSCLENPHDQRSLVGYSPRSHKKLAMTERLSTHTFGIVMVLVNVSRSLWWEHTMRLKAHWKSDTAPSWALLVLVSLCCVLRLCHFFFF